MRYIRREAEWARTYSKGDTVSTSFSTLFCNFDMLLSNAVLEMLLPTSALATTHVEAGPGDLLPMANSQAQYLTLAPAAAANAQVSPVQVR